jgi:uncharacterized RDD family membrane protein YckC
MPAGAESAPPRSAVLVAPGTTHGRPDRSFRHWPRADVASIVETWRAATASLRRLAARATIDRRTVMNVHDQPIREWRPPTDVPPGPAVGVIYAGFWIRVVAWVIDAIALGVLASAFTPLFGAPGVFIDGSHVTVNAGANAMGALLGLVYFVGMWSWRGQTIGMMPFRLWVVRLEDGERPDLMQAFLRYVGLIISFAVVLLGVIWVAFDSHKQGWHDKLASTLVVRR